MNKRSTYKVKFTGAKLIMTHLMQEIEGHAFSTIRLHKGVLRDLLFANEGNAAYLNFNKPSLLRWMIADVKGKSIHYAASRLQVVYRYIDLLCKYKLLPDNPLQEIKPKHVPPSWSDVVIAMQSPQGSKDR